MNTTRNFPCPVWFVRFSDLALAKHYPHSNPVEKLTAIAETDKSVTTQCESYGRIIKQCHHKTVMQRNRQWFFYSEQEAKDFYNQKLNEKIVEITNQINQIEKNRNVWVKG